MTDDDRWVDVVAMTGLRSPLPDPMYVPMMAQLENGAVFDDRAGGSLYYVKLTAAELGTPVDTASGEVSVVVRVPIAGVTYHADLAAAIEALMASPQPRGYTLNAQIARVILRDDNGNERGELYITELQKYGRAAATYLEGVARLDRN